MTLYMLSSLNACVETKHISISTKLGQINGETETVLFQADTYQVDKYLGIPYAKPPVKNLRFKKPLPQGPFPKPYDAVHVPPQCPQYTFAPENNQTKISEDCLFLNIYAPHQDSGNPAGHAVMIFIHGGGFVVGSGSMFKSEILASVGNVIVVTINYRLGLLGFMDLDDPVSPGNFGLWDQRLALQWVSENIGAFGGDKNRVTIFGSSGGAVSVGLHMMYPENRGLFECAVTQSGALNVPTAFQRNNIEMSKHFAMQLGCEIDTISKIFTCLKTATWENISKVNLDALMSGNIETIMKLIISPTIDGEIVKRHPAEVYELSFVNVQTEIEFFRSIKLMNGLNGEEGAVYLMTMTAPDKLEEFQVTREDMNNKQIPDAILLVYGYDKLNIPYVVRELVRLQYTDWKTPDDPVRLRDQLVRLKSDINFNVPSIEMSRIHSNASGADSYVYNFIALLHQHALPTPSWIKTAVHGDEIAPLFGYNVDMFMSKDQPTPKWELELSRRMITYWSNFAKSGFVCIVQIITFYLVYITSYW